MAEVIGILGAMESEVKFLCKALQNPETTVINNTSFVKGTIDDKTVVVAKCGVGKVNAALCAQLMILKMGATKLINTGIAGALGGNLQIFDFVISSKAVYHDFDTTAFGYKNGQVTGMPEFYEADASLVAQIEKSFKKVLISQIHSLKVGLIASGDQFICKKEQKDFIKSTFDPLCVEMEGAAIAQTCFLNKVPFVIIRCLSDMADETVQSTYAFNEDVAAQKSAEFVMQVIKDLER